MTVALVARDLLFGSRIASVVAESGGQFVMVDDPGRLPPPTDVSVVLVDMSQRSSDWGAVLRDWREAVGEQTQPRVIVFGSHKDLSAHAAARAAGFGPMWARSRLLRDLATVLSTASGLG